MIRNQFLRQLSTKLDNNFLAFLGTGPTVVVEVPHIAHPEFGPVLQGAIIMCTWFTNLCTCNTATNPMIWLEYEKPVQISDKHTRGS